METFRYRLGYLSPLEYVSLTSQSFDDVISLQSYCISDVIELWNRDHCLFIRDVCYYNEKDEYYIISDHELPFVKKEENQEKSVELLSTLCSSLWESRMTTWLLKKEKEFYDQAIHTNHPCHYEWMLQWMEEQTFTSIVFDQWKQIMMHEIELCYQPGGKGYHMAKRHFYNLC